MTTYAEWTPGFTGVAIETLLQVRRTSSASRISSFELRQYLEEVGLYASTQLSRNDNVLTLRLKWMGAWHTYDLTEVEVGCYTCPVQLGLGTHLILL